MDQDQKRTAPYLPFSTFISGIDALHAGVPEVLDKSLLRSLSGTAQNQVLGAFRFFELIDEDRRVQPPLKILVQDKENRKAHVRQLLDQFYPGAVALGRSTGTMPQLNAAMMQYGVQGATVAKAVAFFLKAAEFADLPMSPHWKNVTRRRNGAGSRSRPSAPGKRDNRHEGETGGQRKDRRPHRNPDVPLAGETRTFDLSEGDELNITLSRSFVSLPLQDRRWFAWLIERVEAYESGDRSDLEQRGEAQWTGAASAKPAKEEPGP